MNSHRIHSRLVIAAGLEAGGDALIRARGFPILHTLRRLLHEREFDASIKAFSASEHLASYHIEGLR
jgi:hypothetical protein